ncbi:MAG: hypothetical protein IAI48_01285 [Candidatus Eremiobacteraeota bacterium]|nr:hypothetical protein [Candidatus Eremiobacteraeota bacterium]
MSEDRRVLYFKRAPPGVGPQIWMATRERRVETFGPPQKVDDLGTFVEAPSICGRLLYFHTRVAGEHFTLYSITRPL